MTVAVVGGGIAGLAAALELTRRGRHVTLLEASSAVGGKLVLADIGGLAIDVGAESFLCRVPYALDLVAELGRSADLVHPAAVPAAISSRGALHQIPTGTLLGIPGPTSPLTGLLSRAERARVGLDRWLPGSPPGEEPGGDVAVGAWVARRLGRAVVDRLVEPLLGGVYAGRADELSLAATVPRLPRDERSALAAVRRATATGQAVTAGGQAPLSGPVFGSLAGGLGALPGGVAAAVTRARGSVLCGRTVRRLEPTAGGWRVVHGPTTDEQSLLVEAVVLAVPAAAAARLLADVAPVAGRELAAVESASMAVVTTLWRAADATRAAGRSGYLVPPSAGRPVKAATFSTTKWPHLVTDGLAVARCSIGRHRDVAELQRDDTDLVAATVTELREVAGYTGAPVASRVTRWGGGLPQYAVGHLDRVARIRAAVAGVPGLAVCGATYDGVGVPACISTGRGAAAAICEGSPVPGSR